MLNGVGGKTVAEAKRNLSFEEFNDWAEYYRSYGTLNPTRKMEFGFAMIAVLLSRLGGNATAKQSDFMPHHSDHMEIPLDKAMQDWK